ncbi:hypothetical protein [Deinococcus fonticola]|uniref:hypothetical protein n=1 Tax=Deinococcus fonticola TaxID=2528713 RepID=UPI001074BD4C|nr:hypothetical protein [Deinococcus fonticola]
MLEGFDFSTDEVHTWEIEAIWHAIDVGTLAFSRHAAQELSLDGLHQEDVLDAISFYDEVSKDLPDNAPGRAPGINFDRHLETVTVRAKVGWNQGGYYIVITVMAN